MASEMPLFGNDDTQAVDRELWRPVGVYRSMVQAAGVQGATVWGAMLRNAFCFLLCFAAFGQVRPVDPLQANLEAIYKAHIEGRFTDATALREDARRMLERLPVDAPQFGGWVQAVAELYVAGGRTAQGRTILRSALHRADILGAATPVRIQLPGSIADSWREDRNLPNSAEYL